MKRFVVALVVVALGVAWAFTYGGFGRGGEADMRPEVSVRVPYVSQLPEMPTGCEIASV
jgi:hypothetical protein